MNQFIYRTLVVFSLVTFSTISQARNYYLSGSGNDLDKGTSPETSWRSIDRLNSQKLQAGDSILFRCGDTFSGEIAVKTSGTAKKPISYSAFGVGTNPIITGAIEIANWEIAGRNIQVANFPKKVYNLFYQNKQQVLARYPNSGYLKIDGGLMSKLSFFDSELTQNEDYWTGANIRFKSFDWEWRTSVVTQFTKNKITIADSSSNQLNAGWGYYFDNKLEELDSIGEWFYAEEEQKLYYFPADKTNLTNGILASIYENGFTISEGISYIEIRNLTIQMFHNSGIQAIGNNQEIRIKNNLISQIYLTGVLFGKHSTNCVVDNNRVVDNNGRGIFALEPQSMKITNNRVSRIGFIPGQGISGVNGMVGIGIGNLEEKKAINSRIANDNLISHNIVDSIGYGGIRMDGANSTLEYNKVSHVMHCLSDGAAIYCWATGSNYTYNNTIRKNIVYDVFGNREATPSPEGIIANGIYIDNHCHQIRVEGNVMFNLTGSGVHLNSDSYENLVLNNTIYNSGTGLSISEWSKPNSTYGNNISGNIVFCKTPEQDAVVLENWLIPNTNSLGVFSNNTYYNFFEKYYFNESYLSENKEEKLSIKYTFEGWQQKLGYDTDGKAYQIKSELAGFSNSQIFINSESVSKTILLNNFDGYDLLGKRIHSILLQPFSSQIVLSR